MKKRRKLKKKSSFWKFVIAFFVILMLTGAVTVYKLYSRIYQPNIVLDKHNVEEYIYIPTGSDFSNVLTILSKKGFLRDLNSFEWLAKQKKYDHSIKPGRYKIDRQLSNNELVNLLRSGSQSPIKVSFNNLRTKEDLAGVVAAQIEADSISILNYITDDLLQQNLGMNNYNISCLFIPNTYEFYWNTSAEGFVNRMLKEHKIFWNDNRRKKAKRIGLNYHEVSILASIVEKEQNIRLDERPKIAGLYINRIKKKMKLESDPTLIFALGDFTIKRVINKDKKVDSPYNTYKHRGLPPGPICIPSIHSIDAVLEASSHDYIFMCAKEDFSGYHNFSKTYFQHLINARKYQKELNKRRIMR